MGISGPMKPILSGLATFVRWAALLVALACAGGALIGQAGRWDRLLDVANNFAPVWLEGGLVAALAWALAGRRGRVTPALAAIAVVLSVLQVAPEFLAKRDRTPAPTGATQFKVVQFNIYAGNHDPVGTARWILSQDADVVVVEEGFGDSQPVVEALQASYPFRTTCARHAPCSTIIFSRRPPIAEGGLLEPDQRARVAAAWAVYPDPGGPIPVVGMHLTWPFPPGWQKFQSCWVDSLIDTLPKRRLIITGDFNLTPWSFDLRRKDRHFGIERRTRALASFPNGWINPFPIWTPAPFLPIDHVYAGKGWATGSVVRGPRTGSDHFPIVATFTERPGQAEPWTPRPMAYRCD